MKLRDLALPKARIEILPLIDIVFLLLVFFIYAMLSMAVHRGLPVLLPQSSAVVIEKRPDMAVTIAADGSIHANKSPATIETLGDTLTALSAGRLDTGIVLFGDRNTSYQQLFNVLDAVRHAGFARVSLQAEMIEK
ncbi:MAG: biopolymer transporter ExbD [Pseudomonadota bacterium]